MAPSSPTNCASFKLSTASTIGTKMEIARVLFTDIVGYSKMQAVGQLSLVEELNGLISEENQFRQALEQETVITTGDGMALAFFSRREAPRPQRRTNRGYLCFDDSRLRCCVLLQSPHRPRSHARLRSRLDGRRRGNYDAAER